MSATGGGVHGERAEPVDRTGRGRGDDNDEQRLAAARFLLDLLESAKYAPLWRRHVARHRGGRVHQGAVARVLAEYLWEAGLAADSDTALPRRLKDTVSRALSGRSLPTRVIDLFVQAFRIHPVEAAQLWALWAGSPPGRLVLLSPPDRDAERADPGATAATYQTISLHEIHDIGPDGLPASHRTIQVIRALTRVEAYEYCFDTACAVVEVIRGGTAGPVRATATPGIHASRITLSRPVEAGATASFEYRTFFSYREVPPKEFRRGTRQSLDNVDLLLRFHRDALPTRIWWGVWDGLVARAPSYQEEVKLGPDHSVHRFVDHIEGAVVGFHWR